MPAQDKTPEREQTDESLRAERDKADADLGERQAAIEEAADAIIEKARARADRVLAAARAKSDMQLGTHHGESTKVIERERHREDEALREERASADETLRAERAEHALPSPEREATDKDLSHERARSDGAVTARDVFLGIVSHDLRNLLGGMVGFASLIAKGMSRDNYEDQVVAYAQRITRTGSRMNRLVGDLVDVASIEAGVLAVRCEIANPALVVAEAVDNFQTQADSRGITLTATLGPSLPVVSFDPARILQVLVNLLSNAIKFTPPNGKVTVSVEHIEEDVHFRVTDTGEGIPAGKLEAVFDRFLQVTENDRRGVGLGLYISKCIVQGHGGRIWAESAPGKGSTFSFTVPVRDAARAPGPEPQVPARADSR
jgi:signal transduction histidine kinase